MCRLGIWKGSTGGTYLAGGLWIINFMFSVDEQRLISQSYDVQEKQHTQFLKTLEPYQFSIIGQPFFFNFLV